MFLIFFLIKKKIEQMPTPLCWEILASRWENDFGRTFFLIFLRKLFWEVQKRFWWVVQKLFWRAVQTLFWRVVQKLFWKVGKLFLEVWNYFGSCRNYFGKWEKVLRGVGWKTCRKALIWKWHKWPRKIFPMNNQGEIKTLRLRRLGQ